MPIYPTEASWTPSTSSSPDPLYKDKNVTVYGIPILPSSESLQNASSSTSDPSTTSHSLDHSKRKREVSPDSPSKRPALMIEGTQSLEKSSSIDDIMQQADFTPVGLTGEVAQEWRRLMVDVMFPGVKEKMEAQKRKHRKERDRDRVPSHSKQSNEKNPGADNGHSKSTTAETTTFDHDGHSPIIYNNDSVSASPSNVSITVSWDTIVITFFYRSTSINALACLPDFTNNFLNSFITTHPLPWHRPLNRHLRI